MALVGIWRCRDAGGPDSRAAGKADGIPNDRLIGPGSGGMVVLESGSPNRLRSYPQLRDQAAVERGSAFSGPFPRRS
jgi:hypothetical protein